MKIERGSNRDVEDYDRKKGSWSRTFLPAVIVWIQLEGSQYETVETTSQSEILLQWACGERVEPVTTRGRGCYVCESAQEPSGRASSGKGMGIKSMAQPAHHWTSTSTNDGSFELYDRPVPQKQQKLRLDSRLSNALTASVKIKLDLYNMIACQSRTNLSHFVIFKGR